MKKILFSILVLVVIGFGFPTERAAADGTDQITLIFRDENIKAKYDLINKGIVFTSKSDMIFACPCDLVQKGDISIVYEDEDIVIYKVPQLGGSLYYYKQTGKLIFTCPCQNCSIQPENLENLSEPQETQEPEEPEEPQEPGGKCFPYGDWATKGPNGPYKCKGGE